MGGGGCDCVCKEGSVGETASIAAEKYVCVCVCTWESVCVGVTVCVWL